MKVVVVDDSPEIIEVVSLCFQLRWTGAKLISASNGAKGLELIEAENPDIVILDIGLPDMDGFEVLRTLKADPGTRDIPVVMLTAKAQDADVFRGWQSGVDSYLTKPFNPMELLTFIERIFASLEEGATEEDSRYEV